MHHELIVFGNARMEVKTEKGGGRMVEFKVTSVTGREAIGLFHG
jgi:hypothetical protein